MRLSQKEVRIVAPKNHNYACNPYIEDEQGYVHLRHGDIYEIALANDSREDCDVVIEINGKEIGTWRLDAYCKGLIERGVGDTGRLTFYEIGSSAARKVGLGSIARTDLGLVKITFIPEKVNLREIPVVDTRYYSGAKGGGGTKGGDWQESFSSGSRSGGQSVNLNTRSAGGTGLSGRSDQQFGRARAIDRDNDRQVIINLRLVAKPNDEPRPLRAVDSTISNMVPPPVN